MKQNAYKNPIKYYIRYIYSANDLVGEDDISMGLSYSDVEFLKKNTVEINGNEAFVTENAGYTEQLNFGPNFGNNIPFDDANLLLHDALSGDSQVNINNSVPVTTQFSVATNTCTNLSAALGGMTLLSTSLVTTGSGTQAVSAVPVEVISEDKKTSEIYLLSLESLEGSQVVEKTTPVNLIVQENVEFAQPCRTSTPSGQITDGLDDTILAGNVGHSTEKPNEEEESVVKSFINTGPTEVMKPEVVGEQFASQKEVMKPIEVVGEQFKAPQKEVMKPEVVGEQFKAPQKEVMKPVKVVGEQFKAPQKEVMKPEVVGEQFKAPQKEVMKPVEVVGEQFKAPQKEVMMPVQVVGEQFKATQKEVMKPEVVGTSQNNAGSKKSKKIRQLKIAPKLEHVERSEEDDDNDVSTVHNSTYCREWIETNLNVPKSDGENHSADLNISKGSQMSDDLEIDVTSVSHYVPPKQTKKNPVLSNLSNVKTTTTQTMYVLVLISLFLHFYKSFNGFQIYQQ